MKSGPVGFLKQAKNLVSDWSFRRKVVALNVIKNVINVYNIKGKDFFFRDVDLLYSLR